MIVKLSKSKFLLAYLSSTAILKGLKQDMFLDISSQEVNLPDLVTNEIEETKHERIKV